MNSRADRSLQRVVSRIRPSKLLEIIASTRVFRNPAIAILLYTGLKSLKAPTDLILTCDYAIHVWSWDNVVSVWGCWVRKDYPVLGQENIIVDAGANIGAFSLFAAQRSVNARVFAIEPVRDTFEKLQGNIAANGLGHRVTTLSCGVSGWTRSEEIFVTEEGTDSSSYQQVGSRIGTVSVKSLGDLLLEIGNPANVDLLKMDCEGAEMYSLCGADASTLARFGRICLEFHEFSGLSIDDVTNHLTAAGFRCTRCQRDKEYKCGIAWYVRDVDACAAGAAGANPRARCE